MKADTVDCFYNVGTGRRTTIRQLAELIDWMTGNNARIVFEPAGLTFVKNRIGCPKRAFSELGFEAKVSLEEGLQEIISWRAAHKAEVEMRRAAAFAAQ
jgi:UDP-glucose 4-epimerase